MYVITPEFVIGRSYGRYPSLTMVGMLQNSTSNNVVVSYADADEFVYRGVASDNQTWYLLQDNALDMTTSALNDIKDGIMPYESYMTLLNSLY